MWYPVKTRTIAHNLSDERETLYLSYYKLAALHMFEFGDPAPYWGWGGATGPNMVPFESFVLVSYWLSLVTKALSLAVYAQLGIAHRHRRTDRRTELG